MALSDDFFRLLTIKSFLKLHNNQNDFYQIDYDSIRPDKNYPNTYYLQFNLANCPEESFPFSTRHICLPDGRLISIGINVEVNCDRKQ